MKVFGVNKYRGSIPWYCSTQTKLPRKATVFHGSRGCEYSKQMNSVLCDAQRTRGFRVRQVIDRNREGQTGKVGHTSILNPRMHTKLC